MRLSKVKIENFRGINTLELELDRDVTVLIGENNSGKTSVLEALRLGLDAIRSDKACNFTEYDFYRDKECNSLVSSKPIVLTFYFFESGEHLWPENITQALNDVIVGSDYSAIKLCLTAKYNTDTEELSQSWCFLDDAGNEMVGKQSFIRDLRRLRPFFFLGALRAAKSEFNGQSIYWSSFLKNKDIDETTRKALEEELFMVNQKIVDAHSSFKDVTDEIKRISDIVSLIRADSVTVDPVSPDVYKSLRYTEVNLLTGTDAKIPLGSHGEGTQSLSVLLLFNAYLKTRLKADVDKFADPIIAIEEPESHLHPNAIRAIWHLLKDLPGQKVIATHSGDILSEVPVEKLRRMSRSTASSECRFISSGLYTIEELRKFNHHVRRNRGELLFARTWLLVEGETDVTVFSECAEILGISLHRNGVRIVEYSQVDQNIFMKLANDLGINWLFVADGDEEGGRYIKSAENHLNGRDKTVHIHQLSHETMDILLCCSGYGSSYEVGINKEKKSDITASKINEPVEYWRQVYKSLNKKFSKPAAALETILLMKGKGEAGVPNEIKDILEKVTKLAGDVQ